MESNSLHPTASGVCGAAPMPAEFNALTGRALERAIKAWEYDLDEARVQPYVVDMEKELPEVKPLISINNSCVCSVGNLSAICGEAKSKKTFLASALVASAMAVPFKRINNFKNVDNNADINVLWVDTEQGERHVRKVVERITRMTGAALGGAKCEPRLTTLALRELSPSERKEMLYTAMRLLHYDIVVIDGIADLQRNTNDLEESDALVTELMAMSTRDNTHILCILHTNPGSDKARGHLGSSLQRKAETVIFVHRAGDVSIVEPQFCRNEPFERFAFRVNDEGIPEVCDIPQQQGERHEVVALLEDMYGGTIERTTLINKVMELRRVGQRAAQKIVRSCVDRGLLCFDGNVVRVAGSALCEQNEQTNETNRANEANFSDVGLPSEQNEQTNETNGANETNFSDVSSALFSEPPRQSMAAWDEDCPF